MASRTYLDAHVAIWLYGDRTNAIAGSGASSFDRGRVVLVADGHSRNRLHARDWPRLRVGGAHLSSAFEAEWAAISDTPFADVVFEANAQSWTKDPFDRIIVAEAAVHAAPLVTKDPNIHDHYAHALWE
jgi:PIN domain nuclease of toxin-antitoxin system